MTEFCLLFRGYFAECLEASGSVINFSIRSHHQGRIPRKVATPVRGLFYPLCRLKRNAACVPISTTCAVATSSTQGRKQSYYPFC